MNSQPVNLFRGIPESLPEEWAERLSEAGDVSIERIVSHGHCSPEGFWYDQERHEFVVLLSGAARIEFAQPGDEVELVPGDYLIIPAHRRHRVAWTAPGEDSLWLAVHFSGNLAE